METDDVVEGQRDQDEARDREKIEIDRRSGVLDDQAFDDVRDILAAIRRTLEDVENFLPLQHEDGIRLVREQSADGRLVNAVRFVLQTVDLHCRVCHTMATLQRGDREHHLVGMP